ncbi:fumarate hydratase [Methanoregula sp. PtaB.Bin085]|uniref:fumarate hydratase n=1 Tax=Methanoregula sp. PtaB.Bin085 TaxID=1811680 RepID=UPI0009CAD4FA|nr:fumarate hydratase [Methanoregula sp. PtaB.Bin085]OPX62520.1 MAG: fumarate hydratase [Methanoregula sp. PtaB.Bin085]
MKKQARDPLHAALADATFEAYKSAVIHLPEDVVRVIRKSALAETSPVARGEFANILKNIVTAGQLGVPLCQDTGVPVVYLTLPPGTPYSRDLYDAIADGVHRATKEVPLRPNVVDPLTRHNTNNNTGAGMPAIHVRPGKKLTVTVLPKGAGAENMSRIAMLLPTEKDKIEKFVVETVYLAGSRPCPPVIIGVGIGGTFDGAAALAKEALLEPVDKMSEYEQQLLCAVNKLGIGPMGLGGDFTDCGPKVKSAGCHTASLPVAVNIQCWANRHATIEVKS